MVSAAKPNKKNVPQRLKEKKQETPLVRIFASDKTFLEVLSSETSQTMPQILNSIIKKYKRQEFFEDLAGAYTELKANPKAWNEEKKERRLYENTLLDGIVDK
jgi:hypothetical protein